MSLLNKQKVRDFTRQDVWDLLTGEGTFRGIKVELRADMWNKWRKFVTSPSVINFSGYDFSEKKLQNFNLTGFRFRKAIFKKAYLRNAVFVGSDFKEANFNGAKIQGCDFRSANLDCANLSNTVISYSSFGKANLEQADLTKTTFEEVEFIEANLRHAYINGSYFSDCNLEKTNLYSAQLLGTKFLKNNKLTGANLEDSYPGGGDFSGSNLSLIQFKSLAQKIDVKVAPELQKELEQTGNAVVYSKKPKSIWQKFLELFR